MSYPSICRYVSFRIWRRQEQRGAQSVFLLDSQLVGVRLKFLGVSVILETVLPDSTFADNCGVTETEYKKLGGGGEKKAGVSILEPIRGSQIRVF